jgi:hypothetical protein
VTNNLDTLATALPATTDDLLKERPDWAPWRPAVGITPQLSDAELVTPAMMQAMPGFTSEAGGCDTPAPTCGTSSRTRRGNPATTSGCATPPGCFAGSPGSRPPTPRCGTATCGLWTRPRCNAAAPAGPSNGPARPDRPSTATAPATAGSSGACACTWSAHFRACPSPSPTGAKADERETLLDLLAAESDVLHGHPGQTLTGDKNYFSRAFERELAERGVRLLRPARKGERDRPGATSSSLCGRS